MFKTIGTLSAVAASLVLASCSSPETSKPAAPAATTAAAAPAAGHRTKVAFELPDQIKVAALQLDIGYSKASGRFAGDSGEVECQTLIEGALSSYNNLADSKVLKAAYIAVNGIQGPVRFAECMFEGAPSASDIQVTVVDVSSDELTPIEPPPAIKVVVETD